MRESSIDLLSCNRVNYANQCWLIFTYIRHNGKLFILASRYEQLEYRVEYEEKNKIHCVSIKWYQFVLLYSYYVCIIKSLIVREV